MRLLRLATLALAVAIVPASLTAQVSTAARDDSTTQALHALGIDADGVAMRGRYEVGEPLVVAAGDTVRGPVLVVRGDAEIRGTVFGDVTAIFGDVTVADGADVHGSASAWRGRVIIEGGRVRGALGARPAAERAVAAPPRTRGEALALAGSWGAILLIIGLLALVLAGRHLDLTAGVLEQDFSKAFFVGLAAELGFLPLLLLVVAALAVTLVGLLLIPFALVAAPVLLAGTVTLGWLGVALLVGRALRRDSVGNDRAALIGSLLPGAVLLFLPWLVAAALQGMGSAAFIARAGAIGISWVAATAGLGAVLLARQGRKQAAKPAASAGGWQTPTPISGIAAARRPVPARPESTAR